MNKKYFSLKLILTVFTVVLLFSCSKKGKIADARLAYLKKEYAFSGEIYRRVYSSSKLKDEKVEASYKAAECYRLMNDMKNAESWYRKAIKVDPKNTDAQLNLAKSLKNTQKFEEAIVEFNNYLKIESGQRIVVARLTKGCENALKWKNEKTRYNVENVKALNTRWEDFAPQFFKKDQIFITSDREKGVSNNVYGWTGNSYTDLYRVNYKVDKRNPNNISYQMPVLVDKDKLNGKLNDGVVCFDSKFSTIYITKCNYDNNLKGKSCRLFSSNLSGSDWSDPVPLSFSSDSFNCGQPSLTKDGQTLYFSSDMPGSIGGKDIWMVTYSKKGRSWSDPVNLGPGINTEDDEMYPFIHEDGTLYFASAGHVGLGGLDIFMSTGSGTDWSDPINMRSPINSHGDDFAIILSKDKESGYFSSNRDGGRGQDDIYRFSMNPLIFNLSGVVRNEKTKAVLRNAVVTITNSNDTGKITFKTDEVGSYKLRLKSKTDYDLFAAKPMFYDSKLMSQTTKGLLVSTDLVQDFELRPIILETIIVRGILYDLDKADIRPDAALILDSLVYNLNKYPMVRIELGSHTDCRADSLYNMGLSQRRADSAVAYLISHGVDSARIVAKGYGENDLEVKECSCEGPNEKEQGLRCTEEQHQLNRRTTVKILDIEYEKPEPVKVVPPVVRPGTKPVTRPGQSAPTQPRR